MQSVPETTVDTSDTPTRGAMGGVVSPAVPGETNALFDQAIITWNQLRNGARIPQITDLTQDVFRGERTMHLVWKEHSDSQLATSVGSQIADEFAVELGPVWPAHHEPHGLPTVLRQIGEHAIRWGGPINLLEEIASASGGIRSYRVLALPFALPFVLNLAVETLVVVMFDWIEPAPPDGDGPVFFNQDLHADGTSTLSKQQKSGQPYFMVSMPGEASSLPVSLAGGRASVSGGGIQAHIDEAWAGPYHTASSFVPHAAPKPESEPLLLTEELDAEGPVPELLLRNEIDLAASLEMARGYASAASSSEERSHAALYGAISAAHDFSLSTVEEPDAYQAMLESAGLKVQPRAPFTPIVKLVFGAAYDRTRLAEYATALAHARRIGVARGCFATYLADFDGGLKALIHAERQLRRPARAAQNSPFEKVKDRLRKAPSQTFEGLDTGEEEFVLVLARRLPQGGVAMVGKVPEDEKLLTRAARAVLST